MWPLSWEDRLLLCSEHPQHLHLGFARPCDWQDVGWMSRWATSRELLCTQLGCSSMLSKPTPLFLKSFGDCIPWLYLVMTLPSPLWALESRTIAGHFRSTCGLKKPLSRGALEDLQPWKWVGFLKVAADDQILPEWELLLWANYQNLLTKTNSFLNKTYSKTLTLLCPNPQLSLYCHKLHQITTNSLLSATILNSPLKFL